MKIPSLLSLLAALLLAAAPTPALAQSRAGTCYFESSTELLGGGRDMRCTHRLRRNSAGHTVLDVVWADGVRSSYVFWDNGIAEIFSGGQRYLGNWVSRNNLTVIFHHSNAVTGLPVGIYVE